jgi:hypothetical protein
MNDMTTAITADPKMLVMDYTNWRGESARRSIVPTGQLRFGTTEWHPHPGWLLLAWDPQKAAMREFALGDCDFSLREGGFRAAPPEQPKASGQMALYVHAEDNSVTPYLVIPTGRLLLETTKGSKTPTWIVDFVEVASGELMRFPLRSCDFVAGRLVPRT